MLGLYTLKGHALWGIREAHSEVGDWCPHCCGRVCFTARGLWYLWFVLRVCGFTVGVWFRWGDPLGEEV